MTLRVLKEGLRNGTGFFERRSSVRHLPCVTSLKDLLFLGTLLRILCSLERVHSKSVHSWFCFYVIENTLCSACRLKILGE